MRRIREEKEERKKKERKKKKKKEKKKKKNTFRLDSSDFGFICACVSNVLSYIYI